MLVLGLFLECGPENRVGVATVSRERPTHQTRKLVYRIIQLTLMLVYLPPVLADEGGDEHLTALCEAVEQQARALQAAEGNFCAFPSSTIPSEIQPVRWEPTESRTVEEMLAETLPLFGWDTRKSWEALGSGITGKSRAETVEAYWRQFGTKMLDAFATGNATLESASIDVDNDGVTETVYRTTTFRPIDVSNPSAGFTSLQCSFPDQQPVRPYHSILMTRETRARVGKLGSFVNTENSDLLMYRGRTYVVRSGPTSLNIREVLQRSIGPLLVFRCGYFAQ
jgi:hypothetical protein